MISRFALPALIGAILFVSSCPGVTSLKCFQCEDCPTVKEEDLKDCPAKGGKITDTVCTKSNISIDGADYSIDRECVSKAYIVAPLYEDGKCVTVDVTWHKQKIKGTNCVCDTDKCNGSMPSIVISSSFIVATLFVTVLFNF